jgi:hypothetical protein
LSDMRKELEMRTPKRRFLRCVVAAAAAAAIAAPAAVAGGPDDRSLYRGTEPALAPASQSPDDRAFPRGGSDTLSPASLSPDDRTFSRSALVAERGTVALEVQSTGFDWNDAVIGAAFGVALALFGIGPILISMQRRRGTVRAA